MLEALDIVEHEDLTSPFGELSYGLLDIAAHTGAALWGSQRTFGQLLLSESLPTAQLVERGVRGHPVKPATQVVDRRLWRLGVELHEGHLHDILGLLGTP